jgi:hypothetical protein
MNTETLQNRIAEMQGLPETVRSEVILALRGGRDDSAALQKAAATLEEASAGDEAAAIAKEIRDLARSG